MLIKCNQCSSKALISSRENISVDFVKLYCRCADHNCGHTFVMQLSFINTVTPPKSTLDCAITRLLDMIPDQDRKQLLQRYSA